MNTTDLARLIAAIRIFRPDWPENSLRTFLAAHAHRPLRDLAVAAIWITTDPDTTTPGRLNEAGPWWDYARTTEVPTTINDCAIHATGETRIPMRIDPRTGRTICAGCYVDRRADETAHAEFVRQAPPDDARRLAHAARATPDDTTTGDPT